MTTTAIPRPLPGERVLDLSPPDPAAAAQTWARRPNLFPGRALTAPTLAARSAWTAGHVTQRGQAFVPGVIDGLEVGTPPALGKGKGANVLLSISAGRGLAASGEDVALRHDVRVALGALPVVAPPGVLAGDDGFGSGALQDRVVGAAVGGTLADFIAHRPGALPRAGVLLLQPVVTDRLEDDDPLDPCDRSVCGDRQVSYEDWRLADGARLLWYAWPIDAPGFQLPPADALFRNRLAWSVFDAERALPADAALPWEAFGVPLAVIGVDAAFRPQFVDAAAVRRRGGRPRHSRLRIGERTAGGPLQLAGSERLTSLYQAQIEQFAEQVAEAGAVAGTPSKLARQFARLPPCGLLPRNVIDLTSLATPFLPPGMIVDVVPIAREQLDLAIREAASLAAFDKQPGERIRLLVPVSQASYEPRLLLKETIDPAFAETLQRFLRERARALAGRQVLREKAAMLVQGLRGSAPAVPAIGEDRSAPEPESLGDWGPPPGNGGHRTGLAPGAHGHELYLDPSVLIPLASFEAMFSWVCLDPEHPVRALEVGWVTTEIPPRPLRAYWGEDLFSADDAKGTIRVRIGDLPEAGRWLRLDAPLKGFKLDADIRVHRPSFGVWDGHAAFAASGLRVAGKDEIWSFGRPDVNTPKALADRHVSLLQMDLLGPFEDDHGFVESEHSFGNSDPYHAGLRAYANHPGLSALAAHEQRLLSELGVERFLRDLSARVDRVDDLVDLSFAKVQADIYRVRQLMLDASDATRLAVSPTLAGIAQAETATASKEQIAKFVSALELRRAAATATAPEPAPTSAKTRAAGPTVATAPLATSGTPYFREASRITAISPVARTFTATVTATPRDVRSGAPLVGSYNLRNVSIAQRLGRPRAQEALDYAISTRYDAVTALLRAADELRRADGVSAFSGLFADLAVPRIEGETGHPSQPLSLFLDAKTRGAALADLQQSITRELADEGSHFADAADLSDRTIALLRQIERRIQRYRDLIDDGEVLVAQLRDDLAAIGLRERVWQDALAEARHDVTVTRALILEEQARLDAINARRAAVLDEEFRFAAFVRPRAADSLDASLSRPLDPGLLPAPVPECLAEHDDAPDELREMLVLVREAPARWFGQGPKLIAGLDRIDLLMRTVQHAKDRAAVAARRPSLVPELAAAAQLPQTIARVQAAQRQVVDAARGAALAEPSRLALAGWQAARRQAAEVISLGDLIDGDHGRNAVSRAAADFFDRYARVCGCLHGAFSAVPPSLRLDWAETLSQFDEVPNLRNLASLPGYSALAYADRRRLQGLVDWLFDQIETTEPAATGLVNDLVRICLLLASHAPVGRIIAGRLPRPVTARPGLRIPLLAFDPARLRIGMQALVSRNGTIVARAVVEDLGSGEISALVLQTVAAEEALDEHAQVQFADAAAFGALPTAPAGRAR